MNVRLLQIASQTLPVGGYGHSHGLETAVDQGWVCDAQDVERWIGDVLAYSMGSFEAHCLDDLMAAWAQPDERRIRLLNQHFLATRETAEARSASVQMGFSLRALLASLPGTPAGMIALLESIEEPAWPCAWSAAACAWAIEPLDSMMAYLWTWAENQVLVAMKCVPIGQAAGQRVLLAAGGRIAAFVDRWARGERPARSNFAPGLALASAQHETQYSRLFRS